MVGGNYNTIGIGIVISGNGQIWVTQNFGGY